MEEEVQLQEPNVFDYLDYREFMRDYYRHKKATNSSYSYSLFSRKAGLASPNYLKLVIDGERRVSEKLIASFAKGLGLDRRKSQYFAMIVRFSESESIKEKQSLLEKISLKRAQAHIVHEDQEEVLRHWYYWAIREMTLLKNFKPDSIWISQRLGITPTQAAQGLALLLKLGLIQDVDERFRPADTKVKTQDEVQSELIRGIHVQLIEQGIKAIYEVPLDQRELGALTLAIRTEDLPRLKQRIKEFRAELNDEFSIADGNADQVYHVELVCFPLTKGE